MKKHLDLEILSQPDDQSCGPTCLHAVYRYYGHKHDLPQLIGDVPTLESGGTLAVLLGCHALSNGFRVRLHSYNLQVLDPTWFRRPDLNLSERLRVLLATCRQPKLRVAIAAYATFVELGGELVMEDLTSKLIRRYLDNNIPIIAGLSATYLYQCIREHPTTGADDDLGAPAGHFAILHGYDRQARSVCVADPYRRNPVSGTNQYAIDINRVLCAILLGTVTYDANLLIIQDSRKKLPLCQT